MLPAHAQEISLTSFLIDVEFARPLFAVCRLAAPLYYANAERFMDELLSWIRSTTFAVRWLALRFDSIESIDCVGAQMLMELAERMRNQGVTLVFTELTTELKSFLSDFGVLTTIGVDQVFPSVDAALATCNLPGPEQQRSNARL